MDKIYHTSQENPDKKVIQLTADILLSQDVAVVPTDSVYGIACAATEANDGYRRIFAIKKRPHDMKLPLLIADVEQLDKYGQDIPDWGYKLAADAWPGALTVVVKASHEIPDMYKSKDGTIALRLPDSNLIRELVRHMNCPLATTSANIHGRASAVSADSLDEELLRQVDIVIDSGNTPVAIESTIVDCTKEAPVILRQGALSAPLIEEICSERSN